MKIKERRTDNLNDIYSNYFCIQCNRHSDFFNCPSDQHRVCERRLNNSGNNLPFVSNITTDTDEHGYRNSTTNAGDPEIKNRRRKPWKIAEDPRIP